MSTTTQTWAHKGQAGILRYWSVLVGISYELGSGWPGYRYTDSERADLAKLNQEMPGKQLWAFLGLNTLLSLAIAAVLVVLGMLPGLHLIAPKLEDLQFGPFAVLLGSLCVLMVSVGMPAAMGATAVLLSYVWPWTPPQEPGPEVISQLMRKMLRQFFVMGLLGVVLSMGLAAGCHFGGVSGTAGGGLLIGVLRMVAPAVTLGTLSYYLLRRR